MTCHKSAGCNNFISSKYWFYLAFENSYCDDYITEKAYRTLSWNTVPIVRGGANYSKYLPPHSYIDTQDYESPKHLAIYLEQLMTNNSKYQEYFSWKSHYKYYTFGHTKRDGSCLLCKILHDKKYKYKSNFRPLVYLDPKRQCN